MKELDDPNQAINLHEILALQEISLGNEIMLRPLEARDATRMLEILSEDESIRQKVSVASRFHTPEDVAIEANSSKDDQHLIRHTLLKDDEPIGLVSFWRDVENPFDAPDNPNDYGFGYFLDPEMRGRGLITSAVQSIMDIAAVNLDVRQFIAYCEDNNVNSIRVLTKLGFQPTDTLLTEVNTGWVERKYIHPPTNLS